MSTLTFFLYVLPVITLIVAIISTLYNNRFIVEPNERQRLVIRNVFTGRLVILEQGIHFRMPWWIKDKVVDLNKMPHQTSGGQTALTSDGVRVAIALRYNELTGREFNADNGQLIEGGADKIDNKHVEWAVTRTDFDNRTQYVADILSAAIDAVIGNFTADELFSPDASQRDTPVMIPKSTRVYKDLGLKPKKIQDRRDLLDHLAGYIQRETNFRLRQVGYNVDDVRFLDLGPSDPKLQEALDRKERLKRTHAASASISGNLTYREKLAVGTDEQGAVAQAAATIRQAKATVKVAKTIVPVIAQVGQAIADAIKEKKSGSS